LKSLALFLRALETIFDKLYINFLKSLKTHFKQQRVDSGLLTFEKRYLLEGKTSKSIQDRLIADEFYLMLTIV